MLTKGFVWLQKVDDIADKIDNKVNDTLNVLTSKVQNIAIVGTDERYW